MAEENNKNVNNGNTEGQSVEQTVNKANTATESASQPAQWPKGEQTFREPKMDDQQKGLTDVPNFPTTPNEGYADYARFQTEDGKFNKEEAERFFKELQEKDEKYEKRILDLRRKVSDGKAPETKDGYFQDFAPNERYMKYFVPETPDETKEEIRAVTDHLSEVYHDAGLTSRQADDVSNAILQTMEKFGILDTRSDEEKYIEKQEWINEQKKQLGANADNIIRETKNFIETASMFSAGTKNTLVNLMEHIGAPFVSAMNQVKDAYGSGTGGIPIDVSNLQGLPSDAELKAEYMDKNTSDFRKQQIIAERHKAGRKGRLMDALQ